MGSLIGSNRKLEFNNDAYKLEWFKGSKKDWQKYEEMYANLNILQSWAYGKAKEKSEGWVVKRGVIRYDNNIVAFFQALEKSWFLLEQYELTVVQF